MLTSEQEDRIKEILVEMSNEREFYEDFLALLKNSDRHLQKLALPRIRNLALFYLDNSKRSMFQGTAPVAFFLVLMMEYYNDIIIETFVPKFGPEIQRYINLRYWNALCHANEKSDNAINLHEIDKHRFIDFDDIHQVRHHFFEKHLIITSASTGDLPMATIQTNDNTPVENKTFVFGQDVESMSKDQLLNALSKLEKQRAEFKAFKTESSYIKKQVKSIDGSIKDVVELLDAE